MSASSPVDSVESWTRTDSWGFNFDGQLGTSDTDDRLTPAPVRTGERRFTKVAAAAYHSLGLATDGTVWSWGWNGYGQLGNGQMSDAPNPTPVQVVGLTNVVDITGGA
jgi:alpha-tubulin suppressor-like RCC1 family protein